MKVKNSYYTTLLFMVIFAVGILVLYILTRDILSNSSAALDELPSSAITAMA
ncbi:hypothetical protein [Nonlabens spongiae]|uniref:hypothetical protein n=1 Tax=Nonlabens spongiae TaxID=331648 RepID=UPI0012F4B0B2|nr:hypothetical protein [Nonlabens spongiae]